VALWFVKLSLISAVLAFGYALTTGVAMAQDVVLPDPKSSDYMRLIDTDAAAGKSEMQTAIARFKNPDGVIVELVGAVHIADGEYYTALNKRFESYDAVLFEMVGGYDGMTNADLENREQSPISFLQTALKSALALEFQLEGIQYGKDNFFHADMSNESFAKHSSEPGQGLFALLQKASAEQAKILSEDPNAMPQLTMAGLFQMLASPDATTEFKYFFASQMVSMGGVFEALDDSVLLNGRNEVAFNRMDEVIGDGKVNIAIFYGAGHLPGMAKMLDERGFKLVKWDWVSAWMMTRKVTPQKKMAPAKKSAKDIVPMSKPAVTVESDIPSGG